MQLLYVSHFPRSERGVGGKLPPESLPELLPALSMRKVRKKAEGMDRKSNSWIGRRNSTKVPFRKRAMN
jgi:hypothetical protein